MRTAGRSTLKILPLYAEQDLNFRTAYAEVKEAVRAEGALLPGTPGTLTVRAGSGNAYWYRVFNPVAGKQKEKLVGREDETGKMEAMQRRIEFADWMSKKVSALRKLGFQVADKNAARVLVELHNRGLFKAGLVLVGTLAYASLLNELGVTAIAARTADIDLARGSRLKLAFTLPFLAALESTGLPFVAVPGMPNGAPETAVKLPGVQGLRVDLLAPGRKIGAAIRIPELAFAAQGVPYFEYLLEEAQAGATLAGWQCIPVRLPTPGRFLVHKLYSSLHRRSEPEKRDKDRLQAMTLTAILENNEPGAVAGAFDAAPAALRKELRAAKRTLVAHAARYEEVQAAWARFL
jgi:hypothetical protein